MRITLKGFWSASLLAVICMKPSLGFSEPGFTSAYLVDSHNAIVRSGSGLCWRTGSWNPAEAVAECDAELVKKPEAPRPAAPAAPPAPPAPPPAPIAAPPAPKPASQKVTFAAEVLFDFGKTALRPEGRSRLDQLSDRLSGMRLEVIVVVGHADRVESRDDSQAQKLSSMRAAAVKAYLEGRGVEPNRVYVEGKGRRQPVTGGRCKGLGVENQKNRKLLECLQPDRRAEIEVVGVRVEMTLGQCMGMCDQTGSRCKTAADSARQKCLDTPGSRVVVCDSNRSDAMFECDQGKIRCKSQCGQTHY